jgi:hypothetical protein
LQAGFCLLYTEYDPRNKGRFINDPVRARAGLRAPGRVARKQSFGYGFMFALAMALVRFWLFKV